jgi:hypothetical protein
MDGFETAALIRKRARSRQTPIIFLTALNSDQKMFQGYACGAVDYLLKPLDPNVLLSKVKVFFDLFKQAETLKYQTAQLIAINQELRRSEERFCSLSHCSPTGIFVTDASGRCIYLNPRCQTICPLQVGDCLATAWEQVVHSGDLDQAIAHWRTHLQEGGEYSDEFRVHDSTGELRWIHVCSAPMFSGEGVLLGYVGTLEDVTLRKRSDAAQAEMLREQAARQEAEAINRLTDQFLGVLSHELRTPLNAVLGWSRLLRAKRFDPDTVATALESIERNALTQTKMIEDILDLSKIVQGKLELNYGLVNLPVILQSAIALSQEEADAKGIRITAAIHFQGGKVWGDPVRIQQVVQNLLKNAIKFTPDAGTIQINLQRVQDSSIQFRTQHLDSPSVFAPHPEEHVQIQVIDSGVGISPEFLPKVFDRFRQADSSSTREFNGLGLGLAIVRHLVELNGGQVVAFSAGKDQGATFTVKLPIWQDVRSRPTRQSRESAIA